VNYSDATEWNGGSTAINLGSLPGYTYSGALGVNDVGTAVGYSANHDSFPLATEWSGDNIINLAPPGATSSIAAGINNVGQIVGSSEIGGVDYATEWSGGSVMFLKGLPVS
jgi:uncharacterized membrane protein